MACASYLEMDALLAKMLTPCLYIPDLLGTHVAPWISMEQEHSLL
jgi:hypothetical protein